MNQEVLYMFGKLLLYYKRRMLGKTLRSIEQLAEGKRKWGNNLATVVITSDLIKANMDDLFDQKTFIERNQNISMKTCFSDIESLAIWVKEVSMIVSDITDHGVRTIESDRQWVVLNEQRDVNVAKFVSNSNDKVIDIKDACRNIYKRIKIIQQHLPRLTANDRTYLDMRLGNGFNSILIFNELLLGVMING